MVKGHIGEDVHLAALSRSPYPSGTGWRRRGGDTAGAMSAVGAHVGELSLDSAHSVKAVSGQELLGPHYQGEPELLDLTALLARNRAVYRQRDCQDEARQSPRRLGAQRDQRCMHHHPDPDAQRFLVHREVLRVQVYPFAGAVPHPKPSQGTGHVFQEFSEILCTR